MSTSDSANTHQFMAIYIYVCVCCVIFITENASDRYRKVLMRPLLIFGILFHQRIVPPKKKIHQSKYFSPRTLSFILKFPQRLVLKSSKSLVADDSTLWTKKKKKDTQLPSSQSVSLELVQTPRYIWRNILLSLWPTQNSSFFFFLKN